MDLPNLLNKLNTNKPDQPQNFLAIEITPDVVKTALWQVKNQAIEVIALGSVQPLLSLEHETLLPAIDTSLSQATNQLKDDEPDPSQVIFGIPEDWTNNQGLTDKAKKALAYIVSKLQLKAVGFVVSSEAMITHMKSRQGGPVSMILVGITVKTIVVTLVVMDEVMGTHVVGRSDQIVEDLAEGLARFPEQDLSLPPKILLYDGTAELEHLAQELIAHDWQESFNFRHIPEIETLEPTSSIRAIAEAGGKEVAQSLGLFLAQSTPRSPLSLKQTEEAPLVNNKPIEKEINAHPFGFRTVFSEASNEEVAAGTELSNTESNEAITFEEKQVSWDNVAPTEDMTELKENESENSKHQSALGPHQIPRLKTSSSILVRIRHSLHLPKLAAKRQKDDQNQQPIKHRRRITLSKGWKWHLPGILPLPLILGLSTLLLLTLGGIIAYWNLPRAEVSVYLALKPLTKQATFTLDPSLESNEASGSSIPATLEAISTSGSKETFTTGTKIVGERAKGKITIFNRTSSSKTFDKGTRVEAGKAAFTLDNSVTVASASAKENADYSVTIDPSKETVAVTAVAIGAEFNIAKDTKLQIANYGDDTYVARSATELSGGSSREVEAVDENDLTKLKTELLSELETQLTQQITEETMGQQLSVMSDDYSVVSEEFSAEAGDEAKSISLKMEISKPVYRYAKASVTALAETMLRDEIPTNYILKPDSTNLEVTSTSINSDETVNLSATITLQLFPNLQPQTIASNLVGRPVTTAEMYLRTLPGYVRHENSFSINLPGKLSTYPHKVERITVKLKPAS